MHTSVLILIIQPVNKVKTSLGGSSFPAHWHCFMAVLPAQCRRGLSAVITPAGNQHPAELKDPWLYGQCWALTGRPTVKLHAAHRDAYPGRCSPPSRCWLKCSRLLAPHSGTGERGAFWIIIMLLRRHLQHKTGSLAIPQHVKGFFSLSLVKIKLSHELCFLTSNQQKWAKGWHLGCVKRLTYDWLTKQ